MLGISDATAAPSPPRELRAAESKTPFDVSRRFAVKIDKTIATAGKKDLTMDDFKLKKVLGKGSFGKVMLVTLKTDPAQKLMAMKTLRKAALIKRNQLAHTATERHVLQNLDHPFLVKLMYAFQTADKLYMVLESAGPRRKSSVSPRNIRLVAAASRRDPVSME